MPTHIPKLNTYNTNNPGRKLGNFLGGNQWFPNTNSTFNPIPAHDSFTWNTVKFTKSVEIILKIILLVQYVPSVTCDVKSFDTVKDTIKIPDR